MHELETESQTSLIKNQSVVHYKNYLLVIITHPVKT